MTKSLNRSFKARDLLVTPSHKGLAIIVDHLFTRQESEEYKTAHALFDFCVSKNLNFLTLMLLKVYQSSSNGVTRFRSIHLLSETLTDSRARNFNFSLDSLYEIKRVLIKCLVMQETKESDIKILKRIVFFVAYNVVYLHNGNWDKLGDCILSLANSKEPRKAFHIFIDLPPVYKDYIGKFLLKLLERVDNVFLDPYRVEDWSLALQTLFKMWILFMNTNMTYDDISAVMGIQLSFVVNSVIELVNKEKEEFLLRGLEDFERFFSREMNMYQYSEDQCHFVLASMNEIEGAVGTKAKEIVRKIKMLVTEQKRYDFENLRDEFDSGWYDYWKSLSSLEVLKIFASTELEVRSREIAIRWLNVLLSAHTSKKLQIDITEMRELQPLLMSCLKEEGLSDSMFKVLGEVVNHVAYEMLFVNQQETWYELRDYVVSQSKTEFHRAVYIFQCLTNAFLEDDFVVPVMEKLLPEIITRLDPPTELLVDNSCWVWTFTGAFCTEIHLVEISRHVESVKEIARKMIDSVRELVERGMEVGLVRRAFRDVETIVKKQLEWYSTSEYKFLKGLLWRLYTIKGMQWESKIVLWRINVIVERGVKETEKELPNDEFLNLTDYEVAFEEANCKQRDR